MKNHFIINTLKFCYYFGKYQAWGKLSTVATNLHYRFFPRDAVTNITQDAISEHIRDISRYATKKAHTCRVRYEDIGERIIENGR
jgi:hypothetical protein